MKKLTIRKLLCIIGFSPDHPKRLIATIPFEISFFCGTLDLKKKMYSQKGISMHKRITFRGMDHAAAIENYANDKLVKVEEFLEHEPTPRYIDLILEPSKVHEHHRVELRVKSPHYDLISNFEGPDFYRVLDRVIDVMLQELLKEKRKQLDERDHRIKVSKLREFQDNGDEEDEE